MYSVAETAVRKWGHIGDGSLCGGDLEEHRFVLSPSFPSLLLTDTMDEQLSSTMQLHHAISILGSTDHRPWTEPTKIMGQSKLFSPILPEDQAKKPSF